MLFPLAAALCCALTVAARPAKRQQQYTSPPQFGKLINATRFEVVNGTFATDLTSTNQSTFNVFAPNSSFGLINSTWSQFIANVSALNAAADAGTSYKVLFIARHGQGYHNTEQSYVGDGAWNCYWAQEDGNGTTSWRDAELTPVGVQQAQVAHDAWVNELSRGAPFPQVHYSSPLTRAASTLNITWNGMTAASGNSTPIFKEIWRSDIGLQSCNHRRNATYLAATYPGFVFEDGFADVDPLWGPVYQENSNQQAIRAQVALTELFATEPSVFISITAHSENIGAVSTVIQHINFGVQTGGMLPVLVKATNDRPVIRINPGTSNTAPPCTTPVSTAVSGSATSTVFGSFSPNPSSLPTTATLGASGLPSNPSASSQPSYSAAISPATLFGPGSLSSILASAYAYETASATAAPSASSVALSSASA